ncbi:unnamed protein product, partial [Laminaria digitata]
GFIPGRYAPEVILPATLDPLALVQRWKQHTQGRVTARLLGESLTRRRLARVARVVFHGWRTGVGPRQERETQAMAAALSTAATGVGVAVGVGGVGVAGAGDRDTLTAEQGGDGVVTVTSMKGTAASADDTLEGQQQQQQVEDGFSVRRRRGGSVWRQTFAERRAEADLRIARRTVVAGWRAALTRELVLRQAKQEWRLKKAARLEPTFKKFMAYHTWQATERVRIESRLLIDAFLNRGKLKFQDLEPSFMVGRPGNTAGLGPGLIPFRDKAVPGSHLVCEVRVMTRIGEGVVGIQLVMAGGGGGKRTQELPVRGTAVGEKRSTRAHRFTIDTPVERLSRFDCEHSDRLIERLRVVTSGGRASTWFGERLTGGPTVSALPDWRQHSLAATMLTAAEEAREAASLASSSSDGGMLSEERDAAAAAAATAPKWDVQKEYITGLAGVRTPDKLVGLGVITRHVTNSHVFSYLWEATTTEDGGASSSPRKNEAKANQEGGSQSDDKRSSNSGLSEAAAATDSSGRVSRSASPRVGNNTSGLSEKGVDKYTSGLSEKGVGNNTSGLSEKGGGNNTSLVSKAGGSLRVLSRAETKQEIFAQDMRDREKRKEELARLAMEKKLDMERLMRGRNPFKKEPDEDSSSPSAPGKTGMGRKGGPAPPAPQEQFASVLRMRRTDARRALERSIALARAARTYRGRSETNPSALSSLPVVMGLASWLHAALLPQLVPLPVPATSIAELLQRGENLLATARATKVRADRVENAVKSLKAEQRKRRRRQGVMSPAQRAKEAEERQNLLEWASKSVALLREARLQQEEGEQAIEEAREQMPKVSQSVKTLKMYLDYLKLATRQIELVREFGLGALKTTTMVGAGGTGGGGARNRGSGCGIEESLFDATIKSLLHERKEDGCQTPHEDEEKEGGGTLLGGGG